MKVKTSEIVGLILLLFAAFAIPYWLGDGVGLGWSIGLAALTGVIAVAVRVRRSNRSSP
jgi:hypothetical protein